MVRSRTSIVVFGALTLVVAGLHRVPLAQTPSPSPEPPQDARTWLGRTGEMEAYLKSAEMLSFKDLSVGVTKPQRATLPEGGPMKYLVWKTIQPGRYGGYWESYRSEIAAYELDKLLGLNMVPPTVERVYKGVRGAAVMWAAPTKSFHELGKAPEAPLPYQGMWTKQLVQAKMFHNLVANIDPNLGNWLVDPMWNLVLIDFTRAFTTDRSLKLEMTRVDPELWKKMQGLTEANLAAAIGTWVMKGERQALLDRRDKMQKLIDKLVKERGDTYVFMRDIKTSAPAPDPVVYTVRFPDTASRTFTVDATIPVAKRDTIDVMMPVWSPGFYSLQTYADRVTSFSAKGGDGKDLTVSKSAPNRWTITTGGRPSVTATYVVSAPRGSNLSNGVTDTTAVLIGPATFIAPVDGIRHPAELKLELPPTWTGSMTSLDAAPGGKPNHYVAPDYDVLVDSPILAGVDLINTPFTVGGVQHHWTYLGKAEWDGPRVSAAMTPLIEEHIRFWGALPFKKYVFLNIVGGGGSGVEHLNSVAIVTGGREPATPEAKFRNAAFISHEYFHAMNVKRLRPVELGPFDYEKAPTTTGLWVGEGLTSYFGDLLAARAGMGSLEDYLYLTSRHISDLQTKQPGRLVQTIEQASAQMFERIPANQKVDYYVKGPVVGLILDAHIRKRTNDKKSMDDVMRLQYQRWSGAKGYTKAQFDQTVSDAAGFDVSPLLQKLIATTEEIDYSEMLDWFGLRFKTADTAPPVPSASPAPANAPAREWTLEVRPDATAEQKMHLASFLAKSKAK